MERKGISFVMGTIVSMLVVLVTALTVVTVQRSFLSDTGERLDEGTEQRYEGIEISQLRSRCELQKNEFCRKETSAPDCPSSLDDRQKWACNLKVQDEWCYVFWEDNLDAIPLCSGLKSEEEEQGSASTGGTETTSEETEDGGTTSQDQQTDTTTEGTSEDTSQDTGSTDGSDSTDTSTDSPDTSETSETDNEGTQDSEETSDDTEETQETDTSTELVTHPPLDDNPEYIWNWDDQSLSCPEGYEKMLREEICDEKDAGSVENPYSSDVNIYKACCKREDIQYQFVPDQDCYVMELQEDYESCEWRCVPRVMGGCEWNEEDLTEYVGEDGASVCRESQKKSCAVWNRPVCCGSK